jgi:hypothetical protein
MLAQVLQIILGKEHLVKNRLISTLDRVIYFKGTIFQESTKPLLTSQNRAEISWKKILPFFKHASSSLAPRISMGEAPSEWPDWANVHLQLGDCLLWEFFLKITEVTQIFGTSFFQSHVIVSTKKLVGRHFRRPLRSSSKVSVVVESNFYRFHSFPRRKCWKKFSFRVHFIYWNMHAYIHTYIHTYIIDSRSKILSRTNKTSFRQRNSL